MGHCSLSNLSLYITHSHTLTNLHIYFYISLLSDHEGTEIFGPAALRRFTDPHQETALILARASEPLFLRQGKPFNQLSASNKGKGREAWLRLMCPIVPLVGTCCTLFLTPEDQRAGSADSCCVSDWKQKKAGDVLLFQTPYVKMLNSRCETETGLIFSDKSQ